MQDQIAVEEFERSRFLSGRLIAADGDGGDDHVATVVEGDRKTSLLVRFMESLNSSGSRSHWLSAYPFWGVTRGPDPIGAKLSACPGRCAAWSIKGVYSVSPRRRASTPLCLRVLWRNDALQTSISGLPEIGTQICVSRVNPTCVDSYTHRLRDGPGPAVHRFAIARAAPHPGHV